MNSNQPNEFKRLGNGSIDYAYYAAIGSRARSRVAISLINSMGQKRPSFATIASVIGLAILVPFILG